MSGKWAYEGDVKYIEEVSRMVHCTNGSRLLVRTSEFGLTLFPYGTNTTIHC